MSVSSYSTQPNVGFLSLCEGPLLGLVIGWYLKGHFEPPLIFVGAGIAVAALYYMVLNFGRGSAMAAPIIILSMLIWGFIGWSAGGFIVRIVPVSAFGMSVSDSVIAWKCLAALIFAFVAYSDKAYLAGKY